MMVDTEQRVRLLPAEAGHKQLLYGWQHQQAYDGFFWLTPLTLDDIMALPGEFWVAVDLHDATKVIGMASLQDAHPIHRHVSLHLIICREYQRQGYGAAITRLLADYAFNTLNYHKVKFEIPAYNTASLSGADHLGWQREGVRKHEIYASGSFHDLVDYGLLKGPFNKMQARSEKGAAVGAQQEP